MSASPISSQFGMNSPANAGAAALARRPATGSFDALLKGASRDQDVAAVRKAAMEFVSTAFIRPVLSQLRDSPLRPDHGPFAQGAAEKRFGPLLDERIADNVTKAARLPLIETIVSRVTSRWKDNHVAA